MKNKTIGRVMSVGLAGLTAVSSMPTVPVLAEEVGTTEQTEVSESVVSSQSSTEAETRNVSETEEKKQAELKLSETEKEKEKEKEKESSAPGTDKEKQTEVTEKQSEKSTETTEPDTQKESDTEKETEKESEKEIEKESDTEPQTESKKVMKGISNQNEEDDTTQADSNAPEDSKKEDTTEKAGCYSLVEIADLKDTKSNAFLSGNTCYYTDMFLSIASVASVEGDKVTKIELLDGGTGNVYVTENDYTDGDKVVIALPDSAKNLKLRYTVTRGDETFEIVDALNTSVTSLKGVTDYRRVTESFNVSEGENTCELLEAGGNSYLSADGKLVWVYSRNEDISLDTSKCTAKADVNGTTKEVNLEYGVTDNGEVIVSLDTSQLDESISSPCDITLTLVDQLGFTENVTKTLYVAREKAVIDGVDHEKVYVEDGFTYVKPGTKFKLNVINGLYKIIKAELINGDEVVSTISDLRSGFSIDSTGNYRVKVYDIYGNTQVLLLEDLFDDVTSNIQLDSLKADIDVKVNGEKLKNSYYKSLAITDLNIMDDTGISSINVAINAVDVVSDTFNTATLKKDYTLNLLDYTPKEKGIYNISISVEDVVGNVSERELTVKVDTEFPVISNCKVEGDYNIKDCVMYVPGSLKVLTAGKDSESGVKAIRYYKDNVFEGEGKTYTITKSGFYELEVEDNVGFKRSYTLSELLGKDFSTIVVDSEAPEIQRLSGFDGKDIPGKNGLWYSENPELHYKVSDDNLSEVSVTVNGKRVAYSEEDGNIVIPFDSYTEGENTVVVTAIDNAGNQKEDRYSFTLDISVPIDIKATTNTKYVVRDGKAYFKEKPVVKMEAKDALSGVNAFMIGSTTSESGEFTLNSGVPMVRVRDNVGNVTKAISVLSLLGINASEIVVDESKPEITENSGFEEDLSDSGKKWYLKKPTLVYAISDDNLLGVTINVNGKDYVQPISDTGLYTVDLSTVGDGAVNVKVSVEDKSGNTASETYTFYLDTKSPTKLKAVIKDDYEEHDGVIYFKKSPEVSLDAEDSGVGVGKFVVNDKEISGNKFSVSDGSYTVAVKDKLGNQSSIVSLPKLLGMKGSMFVIDGTDPSIVRKSGFSGDITESGKTWYSKKPSIVYSLSDKNILSADIKVNGKNYSQKLNDSGLYTVDLSSVSDGPVNVEVTVVDKAGNKSTDSFDFMLDTSVPTDITGKLDRSFREYEGIMYFDEVPNIQLSAKDSGVGIGNFLLDEESNTTGKFKLSDGLHTVKVVDKLGNTSETVSIGSLVGAKGNRIIIDTDNPSIKQESGFSEDYKDGSKLWYATVPNLTYTVADTNILSVKITVNDKEYDQTISGTDKYKVDLSGVSDGKVTVKVDAEDKAGNTSSESYTFYLDRKAPVSLKGTVNENFNNLENGAFFKKVPTLTLTAEDEGVGVSKYILNNLERKSGSFKLLGGKYTVEVSDILGNTTKSVDLASLLGLKNSTIIVDGDAPVVKEESGFGSDYNGDGKEWFSKVPKLSYTVTDKYLKSVIITVNGTEKTVSATSGNSYSVPVDKIVEGKNVVSIKAEDYSGNVTVVPYTFYLDRTKPYDVKATLNTNSYYERDTGTFFKSVPEVKVTAKDDGVGVGLYKLNDSKKKDGVFKLPTGTYMVSVEDILGNKTNDVDLTNLLGLKSDKIVVDGESPEISANKPSGGVNNWFKEDQSYPVKIKDNIAIQSASITINGRVVDTFETSGRDVTNITLTGDTSKASISADGSFTVEVKATDKAGNVSEWKDTIFVDKTKPTVDKFVFTGTSYSDGAEINGSDRYGFFFNGGGTVSIYASDGKVTSGLKNVVVTMNNKNGGSSTKTVEIRSGVAEVSIPANFKGTISAHAVDNVGNEGSVERPDGIVSETSNFHVNSVSLSLNLPNTSHKDSAGLPLYNSSVNVEAVVGCKASGIRSMKWGVDGKTLGTATVDANGRVSGSGSIQSTDKNLVLSLKNIVPVNDNTNDLRVWVEVTDRMGNTSEASKTLSIDKDSPVVTVTYGGRVDENGYYSENKTAKISIEDRNFSTEDIKITGEAGKLGNWVKSGNRWTATMSFTEDAEYSWNLVATDMAGNASNVYKSPKFVIDKEAPKVRFESEKGAPKNGNYYNKDRKISVVVDDPNFDPDSVKFEGKGELGNWVKVGDTFRSSIDCSKDGSYAFSFSCADKAGNRSETIKMDEFIVDKTLPKLKVEGISDGISYKRNVKLDISFEDENLDDKEVRLSLLGRKNGAIDLTGKVDKKSGSYHFDGFEDDVEFDDVYTLRVHVGDKAGNEVEKMYTFSLNRYGSHYSSNDAELFGNYLNAPRDVVLKEENIDRLEKDKCKVVVIKDGKTLKVPDSAITISESESTSGWAYEYRVDKSVFTEDGMYQVQVYSSSLDGTKYSSVSEVYSFILDTQSPEVVLSGIEDGGRYREYKRKVTIDVRDLSGVDNIVAKVNGDKVAVAKENEMYSFDVVESKGLQNVTVEVTDKAGNVTTKSVSGFYISTNWLVFLVNQPWFKAAMGVGGLLLAVILALIGRRWVIGRKLEDKAIEAQKELYDRSRSDSSDNNSDKDEE